MSYFKSILIYQAGYSYDVQNWVLCNLLQCIVTHLIILLKFPTFASRAYAIEVYVYLSIIIALLSRHLIKSFCKHLSKYLYQLDLQYFLIISTVRVVFIAVYLSVINSNIAAALNSPQFSMVTALVAILNLNRTNDTCWVLRSGIFQFASMLHFCCHSFCAHASFLLSFFGLLYLRYLRSCCRHLNMSTNSIHPFPCPFFPPISQLTQSAIKTQTQ